MGQASRSPARRNPGRAASIVALLMLAGCASEGASSTTTGPRYVPRSSTTTTTVPPPVSTSAPSTTEAVDLLASCAEFGKFQAFLGDDFWTRIWEGAGQTDAGMRDACDFLASTAEPGWLNDLHERWTAIQAVAEQAPSTTRLP